MKKTIKTILEFINYDLMKYYQILITRKQIKIKISKKDDILLHDQIECINKYWEAYRIKIKLYWHRWYQMKNNNFDVRYIPEDIFYSRIEPYLNNAEFSRAYSDKSMYSFWFNKKYLPNTIAKNINGLFFDDNFNFLTKEELVNGCLKYGKLIIKASIESGGGKNIIVIEESDKDIMRMKISKYLECNEKDYVIQEFVHQHPDLMSMNPTSVNTIRMMTLIINNKVEFLSAHIRIGTDNNFYDHNGIVCGIDENGFTKDIAYKYKVGDICLKHPQNHTFANIKIPAFEEIKGIALKEHIKFGQFRLISWDFTVDDNNKPILIEFNLRFQGLNHHQLTSGPIFGNLTDKVLNEVFNNYNLKDRAKI